MDLVVTGATPERIDFYWSSVPERFIDYIRHATNIDGQHEQAYDREAFDAMPPQDKLVRAYGWIHGNCGMTCQFEWASGRIDARALVESQDQTKQYLEFEQNPHVQRLLGDNVQGMITMKQELSNVN